MELKHTLLFCVRLTLGKISIMAQCFPDFQNWYLTIWFILVLYSGHSILVGGVIRTRLKMILDWFREHIFCFLTSELFFFKTDSTKSRPESLICPILFARGKEITSYNVNTNNFCWNLNFANRFVCLLVCFVLWHINLIGHLMPNQVKENKSEKKFKGEFVGIKDKLLIISWLFVYFVFY